MSESKILNAIRDACSKGATRLWRNNTGQGLMVNHRSAAAKQKLIEECMKLCAARGGSAVRLAFGLQKGSGDLIGIRVVEVTPEMVGRRVAVFVSCEVKTETGAVRPEQEAWLSFLNSVGAQAFIARSVADAQQELDKPFKGV